MFIIWLFIEATVFLTMGFIYPNQEELVKWIRINLITEFITTVATIVVDFYKNLYIALAVRSVTFAFSIVAIGCMVLLGWLLGFYYGGGFWGVTTGISIAFVLWFLEYFIYFNYSKSFESYWQNIKKNSSLNGIIKAEEKEAIIEEKEEAHA